MLARDPAARVRAQVARQPTLPEDIRTAVLDDADPEVRKNAQRD